MKSYYKILSSKTPSNPGFSFDNEIQDLKNYITVLEFEKEEMKQKLEKFLQAEIITKENGRYTDDVRAVYQDLVCMGVGINNVENVVRTVIKNIAKMNVEFLPKPTFSRMMFLEARRLSQIQVCDTLIDH